MEDADPLPPPPASRLRSSIKSPHVELAILPIDSPSCCGLSAYAPPSLLLSSYGAADREENENKGLLLREGEREMRIVRG
ncbi:hypothetical protein Dimus_024836 [Dionaea muscipula]